MGKNAPGFYRPKVIYKLVYWSTRSEGNQPYGQQDFDMTDQPPANSMQDGRLSEVYGRLYEDPTIYKLEIWQFFGGFERSVPGRTRPEDRGS